MRMNCFGFDTEFMDEGGGKTKKFLAIGVHQESAVAGKCPQKTLFHPLKTEDHMTIDQVCGAVQFMYGLFKARFVPITWSGTNSDFRFLHEVCVAEKRLVEAAMCKEMVIHHVDLALLMLCDLGVMTGLDVVGFHTLGTRKPESSQNVPELWEKNRLKVMLLVIYDAETTCRLYLRAHTSGRLTWRTRKGYDVIWMVPKHKSNSERRYVKTVSQSLRHREPHRTWDKPITRSSCTDWITA